MNLISFDIETAPFEDQSLYESLMPEFTGNANTKDPEKIKAQIEEKKAKWLDQVCLTPASSKIIAIGFAYSTKQDVDLLITEDEPKIIRKWWSTWATHNQKCKFIGHNIKSFDLWFLIHRTRILGMADLMPICLQVINGNTRDFFDAFIDTMDAFRVYQYAKHMVSLDEYAKAYGLEGKSGDGAGFHKLVRTGKIEEATTYLSNDVRIPLQIAKRSWLNSNGDFSAKPVVQRD